MVLNKRYSKLHKDMGRWIIHCRDQASETPRGAVGSRPRLRLQSGGATGPVKGLWVGGTGKTRGVLGRGLPSPAPALVSLCTRSRAKGARRPGGTGAFRKERKKKPPLARISVSPSRVFCPKHRGGTPLSAAPASLLPIFGLLLEEPVPQPRVAAVVTRVQGCWNPLKKCVANSPYIIQKKSSMEDPRGINGQSVKWDRVFKCYLKTEKYNITPMHFLLETSLEKCDQE
ncbi:uncharacterized protein LOC115899611 [Rhinopithecus roxellana]|uniref:uncharacterized protein LOC115899611 n=1 Tax=Rhinopithecus roxellana TaxID=61622 RepID=UPI0012372F4E|nr:uncharacterized protein LOC115899611 [Rhinopithecus roxellana]